MSGYPLLRKQLETGRFEDGRDGGVRVGPAGPAGDGETHILSAERKVAFAESDESFTLYVDAPLQPIGERRTSYCCSCRTC